MSPTTPLSDGGDGRTVVVGVKLDGQSRELLTWSLVKMAQPGDLVVALHVLGSDEIVDQDGKSSLLSLVKAFDSVLGVYEGFCNLKQVDLKLKLCRGSSIRKIIVREAKAYCANSVILGTASKRHAMRSSASVAKYIARKLSKGCSVLAVNNGKVVFQREATIMSERNSYIQGSIDHQKNSILQMFHRSLSTSCKINGEEDDPCLAAKTESDEGSYETLDHALAKVDADGTESSPTHRCSVCNSDSVNAHDSSALLIRKEPDSNDHEDNSMAIVPHHQPMVASSSISLIVRKLPEARPGWPLLRRALLSERKFSDQPALVRQSSVVQWAMELPSRYCLSNVDPSPSDTEHGEREDDVSSYLDGESGAIVPVGNETVSPGQSHHHNPKNLPEGLERLHEKYSSTCRLFTYHELQSATSNFASENLIGKGGSSKVYRGTLPDGKELAVKILKRTEDVLEEFVLEIEIISCLHHKNVISLFGFCFEENNLLLVYNLLPRGSLEENLHGDKKDPVAFGWSERYKVAIGLAEALHYLHSLRDRPVIHRDVKSANILLSDDFEPQLSDFGLAKWFSISASHITCADVAGTFGYLAPEYFMYGKVTDKIDVYAYGVVLLELLSGRKPISSDHPKGQESLLIWAKPLLNGGKVLQLLDPCISSQYNHEQMERMVLAATMCIRRAPRARPQMSHVLKLLQGDADVMKWARLQVNASENVDDEGFPRPSIQSHLNLALHDIEEDSLSISSIEQHISLEDYLTGRWSRSSSFD